MGDKYSISSTFFEQFLADSCAKTLQIQTVTREKLQKALSYKKLSSKMLMKLTTRLDNTSANDLVKYKQFTN